jgi:hypothetical protein
MVLTLEELDKLWEGQNTDKAAIKLLCRKYSPNLVLDWIHRGLTLKKEVAIVWHKTKLKELGEELIEQPRMTVDSNLAADFGDYFGGE